MAALHLEVAALRLDRLDDSPGARTSIEEALELQPDSAERAGGAGPPAPAGQRLRRLRPHPRARGGGAGLGRRRRPRPGWRPGGSTAISWPTATEARRCFEQALAADPHSAGALRALAALLAAEGRAADARALYERQLELVDEPAAKAAVLTDLARTPAGEKPGEVNLAVARLDEALELAPDYLPAVITMADIYYREQQWAEAERRLLQAIRRLKGQPAEMAQLYHRLGEVYDKLGRLDRPRRCPASGRARGSAPARRGPPAGAGRSPRSTTYRPGQSSRGRSGA